MANDSVTWVYAAYNVVALIGVFLCMYVMQKVELDRINRVDPPFIAKLRRLWFIVLALVLCESILDQTWRRSLPVLLLVAVGAGNLAINAVALHLRSPPDSTSRMTVSRYGAFGKWQALRRFFARTFH